jgi:translocation and assembly module TamB
MTAPTTATALPRRRRWLRWLGLALLLVVLLCGLALGWLLGTGAGLRFALARAISATDGALSVQGVQGRLIGPLDLRGVRYRDGKGLDVRIASTHVDLAFWPLLGKRLHVLDLTADGITVALPPSTPRQPPGEGRFNLQPPLDMQLDRVHIGAVQITRAGQPVFASSQLDLAGSWTRQGLALRQLALRAPAGHADLTGTLVSGPGYRGDGRAAFAWRVGDVAYAGQLTAHSDGRRAQFAVTLSQPMSARLQLDLQQGGRYAWTGTLDVPRFDPRPWLGENAIKSMALSLRGKGDRRAGSLTGRVDLNGYRLLLQPITARLGEDMKSLQLQQFSLTSPQIKGSLQASGSLQLDAQPLSGRFAVQWKGVQLPTRLAGQPLASEGSLEASGSLTAFHAGAGLRLGPPGKPADLTLDLDGTDRLITLHALTLKQPQGSMQASGSLSLQPELAWQFKASADRLDPGQWLAGWDGALNFDIASQGRLPKQGPDATLEIRTLDGTLRQRDVRGAGKLHLSPARVVDGQLALASGGSSVKINATPGSSNAIDVNLTVASLGDFLPDAGGHLDGHFRIAGTLPIASINGTLHARALTWRQQHVDRLQLIVGLPDLSRPAGKLELTGAGVHLQGLTFQRLHLLAEGSEGDHRLAVTARGTQLSGELALHGARHGAAWNGTLSTLNLDPQGLPRWHLQQATQLGYANGALSLSELCLSAGEPLLCVAANRDTAGNLNGRYRLRQLPLALLLNAAGEADLPLRVDGVLQGDGKLRRSAAGELSGTASISSDRGSVTHADHAGAPLLSYNQLRLNAEFSPGNQRIDVHGELDADGRLDGQMTIDGKQQALGGQLNLRLNNLAFIELLNSDLANVKGGLDGNVRFGGTLQQPAVTGQARITDFAVELPAAGLKLTQGRLLLSSSDAKQFQIDGSVQSGKGTLAINGHAGLGATAQTSLTLKGSQFTAADIPAARLVISPDLTVQQDGRGITIGGAIAVDSADVNLEKLPGAGATRASPDVVVIDRPQQEKAASRLPISARVKVDLGSRTHLVGMGLDGRLSGVLTVTERPGRAASGQGQLAIDGTYKAYGQNLEIQRGQLLFAGTPIDNPGLNIRAIRKLNPNATIDEGQVVGLNISGNAQRPVLTVFSRPVMDQSDALSYLVTGKPLSQVKGGEGSMVSSAAQALGSAAGDLLARSVGSKIGIDVGVSSSAALGGGSAFTVGKYLSPRLYLSYGVGLFDPGQVITLRYRLGKRWNLEAQSATDFNRASLNYRIEK